MTADEVDGLVTIPDAIEVMDAVSREEVAGTTMHMPPFGGQHARPPGLPPARTEEGHARAGTIVRMAGGAAVGLGRVGVRAGGVSLLFDTNGGGLLGVMGGGFSNVRISACVGLAAKYLSRSDAHRVAMLGSGRLSRTTLAGLLAVRAIDQVLVYSPTAEHREAFARKTASDLGVEVVPAASTEQATRDADIIALATDSPRPVLMADQVQHGTHVTSVGEPHEIDASVYLAAKRVVASSRRLELAAIDPSGQRVSQRKGLADPPLWELLASGKLQQDDLVELGAIVAGSVSGWTDPSDITVFLEAQGGAGDVALANLAFERARALGRGTELHF
jgi:alanine dehydrogenase